MSYNIEDLHPSNPILLLDSQEIELSIVTLRHEVIFIKEYGNLTKVFEKIKSTPEEILKVIWILVIDKPMFKNSFEVFKNHCYALKESIVIWSKKMSACLNDSVILSIPKIKNIKRAKDIQKINQTQTNSTPCYAVYYDTIAKRYGYTLDQFYALTLRQVHLLLTTINDKSYDELEVQAALHNVKLKPRLQFTDISEEEEKQQDDDALDSLKRLQEAYRAKMSLEDYDKLQTEKGLL